MSSNAPAAVIAAGDHLVDDDHLLGVFVAALQSYPGGFVIIRRWQEWIRQQDGSQELLWQWLVTVGGQVHGYAPNEFLLDMAVPLRPGSNAAGDPATLELRGRAARLLGLGEPAPTVPSTVSAGAEEPEEEQKVLQLPVAPTPPQATYPDGDPNDPNLFPG